MSSRGRPCKVKSPDSNPINNVTRYKEEKQEPPTRCPAFTEKKQKETTETKKARDQKKPKQTDEKPSAHNTKKGKTTNHDKVETNEQNDVPKNRKAKTCSTRTKTTEKSACEAENTPPDTLKEQEKISKTRCASRAKSAESPNSMPAKNATTHKKIKQEPPLSYPAFTEEKQDETTKNQKVKDKKKPKDADEKPSNTEEDNEPHGLPTVPKAKICSTKSKTRDKSTGEAKNTSANMPGNAEFPEESAEEREAQLERLQGNKETCGGTAKAAQKLPEAKVNSVLKETLHKLRIQKEMKSNTSKVVNEITTHIIKHLKKTESFKDVDNLLGTGSYYENVKISDPDEFDVMLCIPVERVQVEAFGDDGAFYSVAFKRGNNPLEKFQKGDVLSASEMLTEFREEVKECLKEFTDWSIEKKKKGCPAVTITTTVEPISISLDVILCLKVKSSWPIFTKDGFKIEKWLGTKEKQVYKREPYYLVPKYEGIGTKEKDGVLAKDVWRVSFSHVEKAILKSHGSEKTCCEKEGNGCCRKDCLKLLKHLLHLLKEKNKNKFDKFCSYHVKTTLLHACCSRPKDSYWEPSDLNQCFQQLLEDFTEYLKKGELYNFFIPSHNLLSGPSKKMCNELADCIKEQCEKGFPLFKEELVK